MLKVYFELPSDFIGCHAGQVCIGNILSTSAAIGGFPAAFVFFGAFGFIDFIIEVADGVFICILKFYVELNY